MNIYIAPHADDAAGNAYADCSEPFLKAMEDAISIGTYGKVHLVFPFADKNKAGVVKTGLALGTPHELTWSCYEGGEKPCGTCGTCRDRAAAFFEGQWCEGIRLWTERIETMYTITKRMEVSGAHFLHLDYESKCSHLHGHNWIITVTCQRETLDFKRQ